MPSPFPGMDPYMEDPSEWKVIHNALIVSMMSQLNARLPKGFAARQDERVYLLTDRRSLYPDIAVARRPSTPVTRSSGGIAVQERSITQADTPRVVYVEPEVVRERFVEIVAVKREKQVIAVIEVLSPTSKADGGTGRDEYRRKQADVLNSKVHLLEIDFLRSGLHTVAVPEDLAHAEGHYDYLTCLRDASHPDAFLLYPVTVRDPLPRLMLPLTEDLEPVLLDLQTAFSRAYDDGPFRHDVDYTQEPVPRLSAADSAWADALLREKGLRP